MKEKIRVQETGWLRGLVRGWRRALLNRKLNKTICLAIILLFGFQVLWSHQSQTQIAPPSPRYLQRGAFRPLPLSGHVNTATSEPVQCDHLRHHGEIQVQSSFHLDDDMLEIAKELDSHPMIDYSGQDPSWTFEEKINHTWARMSGSSVWLEQHNVFFSVTRVVFYTKGKIHWGIISFLRGQVYDQNWNELRGHVIEWQGRKMVFPTTYHIPTPYEAGGCFYGPEDPRIIVEEGVQGAEPVVIYNMAADLQRISRAMYILRPFSDFHTILTINGQKVRAQAEKNWAPFFYDSESQTSRHQKQPNPYIHFIHRFKPLKILKCKLSDGLCDLAYEQHMSEEEESRYKDRMGRMSGGTNLVQIPIESAAGTTAFVGFPRTHIEVGCKEDALYRPQMMVMTASSGSHFHLDFLSDSIDFDTAILTPRAQVDPCGTGRILIANSVARWDRSHRQDVMTISLSVADSTVQILRVHGILAFIKQLPHLTRSVAHKVGIGGETEWDSRWSSSGHDVLGCTVEAAHNYSLKAGEPVHGVALASMAKEPSDSKGSESEHAPIQNTNG